MDTALIAVAEAEGRADYSRQRGYYNPSDHGGEVTIVGAGGIGSPTALALAKLGVPQINVIDFDTVELHNVSNQMYALDEIGAPKAQAAANLIHAYSQTSDATAYHGKVTEDGLFVTEGEVVREFKPSGIVVSALDSMEARAHLWQAIKGSPHVPLLIDGRLGGEAIVVYAAQPNDSSDQEFYEGTLHTDSEGVELPCSRRNVIDVSFAVAALICRAVRRHLAGHPVERTAYLNQATLGLHTEGGTESE